MKVYNVRWFEKDVEDYDYLDFSTKKAAMNYYKEHHQDKGTSDWQVIVCDEDGNAMEWLV